MALAPPNGSPYHEQLDGVERALSESLAPFLDSRKRVRGYLRNAMANHASLRELWHGQGSPIRNESLFRAGHFYRERDDGRVDQKIPWAEPYSKPSLLFNAAGMSLVGALLGDRAELKGLHAIHALGRGDTFGTSDFATTREPQHWHRDTELLWSANSDNLVADRDTHAYGSGVFTPPYAVNVFVPLRVLGESDGPTEFTLGSHLWGDIWGPWEEAEAPLDDVTFAMAPRGTLIFSDYRTIHRGTVNHGVKRRSILMLIFGRKWWEDRTNYGAEDYGGTSIAEIDSSFRMMATRKVRGQAAALSNMVRRAMGSGLLSESTVFHRSSEACLTSEGEVGIESLKEKMFWSLTAMWEEGLRSELGSMRHMPPLHNDES